MKIENFHGSLDQRVREVKKEIYYISVEMCSHEIFLKYALVYSLRII